MPPDELPPPSAELVLIRAFVEAYLASAHKKPRERATVFLEIASEILANEESASLVFPIRALAQHQSTSRARRQAIAMYRQYLPTFFARLPRG